MTETHLKSYHLDAEVACANYDIVRADRPEVSKGGVAIYMHKDISIDNKYIYVDQICQAVIIYNKKHNLLIAGIYRPPTATEESFTTCLQKIQDAINIHKNADIQIHGDFNMPFIDWSTREINRSNRCVYETNSAKKLITFLEKNLLVQLVNETTRENNTLDLLLTNNEQAVHSISTEKVTFSDHDLVNCNLLYKFKNSPACPPNPPNQLSPLDSLNFNKADWESIRSNLDECEWNSILDSENDTAEEMFKKFEDKITDVCSSYTPQRLSCNGKKQNFIPRARQALLRNRRKLNHKINVSTYLKPDKEKCDQLNKRKAEIEIQIRDAIREETTKKEIALIEKIKVNPRAFYTYAKKNSKTYTSVGPLLDENNKLQSDPVAMCNILQNQYKKTFSDPNSGKKEPVTDRIEIPSLKDFTFNEEDIIKAINEIPLNSAPGPDKIPSILLKECKKQIAPALYILWRKSLDTGEIPEILKKQSIIPIHKKDSKATPANYRPISLTSHIIKLFERILRVKIVNFLETNNLIKNSQHGFRPGRSCFTQLLHHIDDIISILERNENADSLYLDLSKAFDKVNHAILIHKLKEKGISGKILTWLNSFLTNRTQQVVIDGSTSSPTVVSSGVPQGTVLGPVLFIIYMDDMNNVINHCLLKMFADDSKLIKNIKNQADREKLKEDLRAVLEWTKDNSMEFNSGKFQLLQHGRDNNLKQPYELADNIVVEQSESVKDLGVFVSSDLSWRHHINTIANNATKFASWILRTIISRDQFVMLLMFKSFVLSRLEYSSPVWHPSMIKDINKLEAVQRSFTASIQGMEDLDYWARLRSLKLYSIQRRRERYIIIHLYKMYKSIAPNDIGIKFHEHIRLGPQCTRKAYPTSCPASVRTIRQNSFSCIGPRLFNIIPKQIKMANSLQAFKSRLDKLLQQVPDQPPVPGYPHANSNSLLELVHHLRMGSSDASTEDDEAVFGQRT